MPNLNHRLVLVFLFSALSTFPLYAITQVGGDGCPAGTVACPVELGSPICCAASQSLCKTLCGGDRPPILVICPAGSYGGGTVICKPCPSDYPNSAEGSKVITQCYKSCTRACTRQRCPANATCTHGSSSTSGKYYYGGSCDAPASTCSISISCKSGYYKSGSSCPACTGVSATDLSQSCSRSPTSTELSNAHAYAGTMTGGTQQCTGNHTSGPIGAISASQCTGCSSWGSCSGGTLTITSCAAGYYKDGQIGGAHV